VSIELELPFAVDDADDLEALLSEIDRAVDASFLSDVGEALRLAKAPAATASASDADAAIA
jgi:hypothetical protein